MGPAQSPEIRLLIFQALKSPELEHRCWKSQEKVMKF